ncbi:MAG: RAD55 family ATPase, partial [Ktedonobacterales bacterium]
MSLPLDSTGIAGLDEVLGGGVQRGSLAIIAGPPGGGKTILAHQIAFQAARAGRNTTILTAFSEPTNKLIAHMRPFSFFDQDLLGGPLNVLSIQQFLRQGLESATEEIVGAAWAAKANLVVLDGFRGVRETAEHPEEARRFIYDVSNRLGLLGVTLLVTSEANVRDAAFFLEATTADVLLGLAFDVIESRERRTLEVLKVRGAAPLTGRHALRISDDGVTIYPRIEARVARQVGVNRTLTLAEVRRVATADAEQVQRGEQGTSDLVHTGVPGLDILLDGGVAPYTTTLVAGDRGAGKTLLALRFALEGVHTGETSLFVGFRETAAQLVRKSAAFAWGHELTDALASGALTLLRTPPVELRADIVVDNVLSLLDETGARRLIVDGVGELVAELSAWGYQQRASDVLAALAETTRLRGVTTLFTRQAPALRQLSGVAGADALAALADNLLALRHDMGGQRFERSLAIVRTEHSSRQDVWHSVFIEPPDGLSVQTES